MNSASSAPKTPSHSETGGTQANETETENNDSDDSDSSGTSSDEEDKEEVTQGNSSQGKTKDKKFWCSGGLKACGLEIPEGEASVGCDMCQKWFHPKCQGLPIEAFKALTKNKKHFLWLCMNCKPNLTSVVKIGKGIEKRLVSVEKNILQAVKENKASDKLQNEKRMESVEENILRKLEESKTHEKESLEKNIETKISNMGTKLCKEITDKQKQLEVSLNKQGDNTKDLKRMVENQYEKDKRERNIILHNIMESRADTPEERIEHDKAVFMNVVAALVGNQENIEVEKVFRLGKKPDTSEESRDRTQPKGRLMLIRLKEKDHVNTLIKRRTQLKEKGFPNVYLTRDLTPEERETQRKLRAELERKGKDTHKIFRGKVVPREERGQERSRQE